MARMPAKPDQTAAVWVDADRAELARRVLGLMGKVSVVAVGGPSRAAISELAASLGAVIADDFRKMLVDHRPGSLLLASGVGVARKDLREARAAGTHVIAVEPPEAELDASGGENGGNPRTSPSANAGVMTIAPWFRLAPAWQAAAEPEQVVGKVQAMTVTCVGPATAGSLFARLYDAYDLIAHHLGSPDAVAASLTGPLTDTPEDLRAMTGHLTVHLRFAAAVAAVVTASDRAPVFRRRVNLIGSTGQLMLEDDRYQLYAADGSLVDSLAPSAKAAPLDPAALVAAQWRRVLDHAHLPRPADGGAIVACCHATLLSCRTGEIESTQTLLRISGG